MSRQKVDNGMIIGLTSSKLTGAMPAIDGSALTGIDDGVTKSASDPAINTNPSGGLGTMWFNTSSGEMFACTDATTDSNVWTNVGSGTGDIVGYVHGASTTVFKAGGHNAGGGKNSIEAINVSSGTNSVDVADLAVAGGGMARASNDGHSNGYVAGGYQGRTTQIDKFNFSTQADATTVASLATGRTSGEGSESQIHAYVTSSHQQQNIITKYSMVSDSDDSSVGTLGTNNNGTSGGHSTAENGYDAGGFDGDPNGKKIDKYSHSSDGNTSAIGDLTNYGYGLVGYSNDTHGYTSFGYHTNVYYNIIDRHSFSSDGNATDWADLTRTPDSAGGGSSTTHGFNFGGHYSGGFQKEINKFPFASQTNATDIGDLAGDTVYRPSGMNF
jgi:hypothetical protein